MDVDNCNSKDSVFRVGLKSKAERIFGRNFIKKTVHKRMV